MGKQNTKVNIPMCAALVLLLLTMISVHLTSGLYARYTSTASGSDSARVAKFHVDSDHSEDVIVDCRSSDSGTYEITVENQSEVAIKYVLVITPQQHVDGTDLYVNLSEKMIPNGMDDNAIEWEPQNSQFKSVMTFTRHEVPLAPGDKRIHQLVFGVYTWRTVTGKTPQESIDSFNWELDFTVDIKVEQVD